MQKASLKIALSTLLLLCAAVAFFLFYQNKSSSSKWLPENLTNYTNWYQINWHKQAIGWSRETLEVTDNEFIVIEEDYIEGKVSNKPIKFEFERKLYFSKLAPYRMLSGSIKSKEGQVSNAMLFDNKQSLEVVNIRNNVKEKFILKNSKFSLLDYLAVSRWLENNPKKASSMDVIQFDNPSLSDKSVTFEVLKTLSNNNSEKASYLIKQSNFKDSEETANWYKYDQQGTPLFIKRPSGMEFVKSSGKTSLNPAMQKDLYLQTGIKVDRPLGEPRNIQSLVLSLTKGKTEWLKKHKDMIFNQQRITLESGSHYKVLQQERLALDKQVRKFSDNKRILKLAQESTNHLTTKYQKVKALTHFVNDFISYQAKPSPQSINDILQNKVGDCTEYAALMHSMLESLKIPAREVSGLVYLGDEEQKFGGHVWLEVMIDGYWLGVDPTWNLMELSSTHIPLSYSEQGILESIDKDLEFSFAVEEIIYK